MDTESYYGGLLGLLFMGLVGTFYFIMLAAGTSEGGGGSLGFLYLVEIILCIIAIALVLIKNKIGFYISILCGIIIEINVWNLIAPSASRFTDLNFILNPWTSIVLLIMVIPICVGILMIFWAFKLRNAFDTKPLPEKAA